MRSIREWFNGLPLSSRKQKGHFPSTVGFWGPFPKPSKKKRETKTKTIAEEEEETQSRSSSLLISEYRGVRINVFFSLFPLWFLQIEFVLIYPLFLKESSTAAKP
jgi:hypothetical protein